MKRVLRNALVVGWVTFVSGASPANADPLSDSQAFAQFMTEVSNHIGGTVNLEWEVRDTDGNAPRNPVLNRWVNRSTLDCRTVGEGEAVREVFLALEDLLNLHGTHRARAQYDFIMALDGGGTELCSGSLRGETGREIQVQTLVLGNGEKLVLGLADHG
jgi:hypothetical protein